LWLFCVRCTCHDRNLHANGVVGSRPWQGLTLASPTSSCSCAVTGRRPVRNIIMLRPKSGGVKMMAAH